MGIARRLRHRAARYPVEALLHGRTFVKFHVDVAVGDIVLEPVKRIECADWLGFAQVAPPVVMTISPEQQFAEKFHAYTLPRSTPNSRVRDLVDLVLLARSGLEVDLVRTVVRETFTRRGTHAQPEKLPAPAPAWSVPFEALARQCGMGVDVNAAFLEVAELFARI